MLLSVGLLAAQNDSDHNSDSGSDGGMMCAAEAGRLLASNPGAAIKAEGEGVRLEAKRINDAVVPDGYEVAYVLTTENDGELVIQDLYTSLDEAFVLSPGNYRLHTFVAELDDTSSPNYVDLGVVEPGVTTASDVLGLLEANDICAALEVPGAMFDVYDCDVTGGLIYSQNGTNEISVCPTDGPVGVVPAYAVTANAAYVITDASYDIVEVVTDPDDVDFSDFAPGTYNIFLVTYTGELATGLSGSIYDQVYSDRCYINSDNEIIVTVDEVDAGQVVTTADGATVTYVCTAGDGNPDVIGFSNPGAANLEYAYVITDPNNVIIGLPENAFADFDAAGPGVCWVYGVSYTGELTLSLGDVLGEGEVATGCAAVTDGFIAVVRADSDGGMVNVAGEDGQIDASDTDGSIDVDVTGNDEFSNYAFFLIDDSDGIVAISEDGTFELTSLDSGKYFVWGLSYTGELQLEVGDDFFGTSDKSTGCSATSSNAIVITAGGGDGGQGGDDCPADAGALQANNPVDTIFAGQSGVALDASVAVEPTVPAGYEVVYLLTYAEEKFFIVGDVYSDFSEAFVFDPNLYRLQILVGEFSDPSDPDYFDLASIEQGTTTLRDLRGQFAETGICIALSEGVLFDITRVGEPGGGDGGEGDTCDIDAGTLTADNPEAAIGPDGSVVLMASVAEPANVTDGCLKIYVLTSGDGLQIIGASEQPAFEVGAAGTYRIHSLVANRSDVDRLAADILAVVSAVTQTPGSDAAALLALIEEFDICADLSAGALFNVTGEGMGICLADAGSVVADADSVTLNDGTATVAASADDAPRVPVGFSLAYVLTTGDDLTIEALGLEPSFTVDAAGDYRVHPFVVPAIGNALFIEYLNGVFASTPVGAGLLLEYLASTTLCYDLDATGALVNVSAPGDGGGPVTPPAEGCQADAGTLSAVNPSVDLAGGTVDLTAQFATPASEFDGKAQVFVLTQGDDLSIAGVSFDPVFAVGAAGTYRIHSFVFDRNDFAQLDVLSLITQFTGASLDAAAVLALVESIDACADLSAGAAFTVTGDGEGACFVASGSLTPVSTEVSGSTATITAAISNAPRVPAGYAQAFILSQGGNLIIREISLEPTFEVAVGSDYTIHSVVLPNALNEQVVAFVNGQISGLPITAALLIDLLNGADVCYSLDVPGASFSPTSARMAPKTGVDFTTLQADADVVVEVAPSAGVEVAEGVIVTLTDFSGRTVAQRRVGTLDAATTVHLPAGQSRGIHAVSVTTARGIESQNVVVE